MELKMRINKTISFAQSLGIFDVSDEGKVRFVIEGADSGNTVLVKGRISGQTNFTTLKTLTGAANEVVNVFTYEELEVECTVFESLTNQIKILASSFNEASGSAIESIGVPAGGPITDIDSLNFTSSDNSITIVGNNTTKTLDFTTSGTSLSYTPDDFSDWNTVPTNVSEGLDQLADRINTVEDSVGAANGIAPLNGSSKIDPIYLPSFVDDVEEYADLSSFPPAGESSKIYVALDTNRTYRWGGSSYIEISPSPVTSVAGRTGDVLLTKSDVGLDQVDNTSDVNKPISNDTQDALDLKYDASNPAGYVDSLGAADAAPVQSVAGKTGDVLLDKFDVGLDQVDNTSDLDKPISNDTQDALDLKADVGHTHNLTDLTQSGANIDQFPKWDSSNWVASDLNASFTYYTPDVSVNWLVEPAVVSEALDELSSRVALLDEGSSSFSSVFSDMKEPTGFVNRTDSEISFDNGTRTFTIQPTGINYSIYHLGVRTIIDVPLNITIPDTSGNYYIYIGSSANLTYTTTFDLALISEYAYCAYIYWDDVDNKAVIFGDERHGITMDGTTHAYLHTTRGTQLVSGAAISYTLGSGALDAHAQISLGDMQIKDEDITVNINNDATPDAPFEQILFPIAEIPIVYREGSIWKKSVATQFPMIVQSGDVRASYNEFTGVTWQLTEAPSNNKTLVTYIFATTSVDEPVIGILGQTQYNNIDEARGTASWENINFGDLPSPEMKLLYTLYYDTSSGYANAAKSKITYVADLRFTHDREVSAAVFNSDHANLSGLGNDDHLQYHNDTRGDLRYYTKTEIDSNVIQKTGTVAFTADQSMGGNKLTNLANPVALTDAVNLQTLNAAIGSTGDIFEKSFTLDQSQTNISITDFVFSNAVVRGFEALVTIQINAISSLSETFEIKGIQKNSGWFISVTAEGDNSLIDLSITNAGQMQYSSPSYAGFTSGVLKFRAITTSV